MPMNPGASDGIRSGIMLGVSVKQFVKSVHRQNQFDDSVSQFHNSRLSRIAALASKVGRIFTLELLRFRFGKALPP
jgi:hypothetical protein